MTILFDGEKAFSHLKKLAVDIGTRPSGTDKEREASGYIAAEFRALGLETSIQDFELTTGEVVSKRLEVLEPYHEEVICEAMPLFGGTGPEGITGDLIYLEGTDEEYLTPEVRGKVVMTSRFSRAAIKFLADLKPLAVINIETSPRVLPKNLYGSLQVKEKYISLPTIRISYEDGLQMLEKDAKRVHILAETKQTKVKSQNVMGELKGESRPEEIILVGGHYDTVLKVSGAGDNAGGAALVMELARVFKKKGSRRTMRFIAWGCEELGLLGSYHYARKLREESEKLKKEKPEDEVVTELDQTKLCINLDVHGAFLGSNSCSVLGQPDLTTSVKLLSKELGTVYEVREQVYSSDGTSLSGVGVPSLSFSRNGGSNVFMHSIEDDIRWLKPQALQSQGNFVEEFLTRYVGNAAAFPFEKSIPDKLRKDVEEYFSRSMRKLP